MLIAQYIEDEKDVLKLLILNKEISGEIRLEIYKECLLRGTKEHEH